MLHVMTGACVWCVGVYINYIPFSLLHASVLCFLIVPVLLILGPLGHDRPRGFCTALSYDICSVYFVLETPTLHPATSVYSNYSKFVLEVDMLDMRYNKSI